MKTKEDYLLGFESKLLSRLTEDYKAINKNIIFAFTILFAFLLFEYGVIEEASVAGNKLKLSENKHLYILPALILIPYFLINYQIVSIARILEALGINSENLLKENKEARPFLINDLDFYSPGIAGIQLQVSKFAFKNYINKRLIDKSILKDKIPQKRSLLKIILFTILLPFTLLRLTQRFTERITWMGFGIFFLAIIYVVPLIIPLIIVSQKLSEGIITSDGPVVLTIIFLSIAILYTLGSNIFLYSFYFSELFGKLKDNITKHSFLDSEDMFNSIIKLYMGDKNLKIETDENNE